MEFDRLKSRRHHFGNQDSRFQTQSRLDHVLVYFTLAFDYLTPEDIHSAHVIWNVL